MKEGLHQNCDGRHRLALHPKITDDFAGRLHYMSNRSDINVPNLLKTITPATHDEIFGWCQYWMDLLNDAQEQARNLYYWMKERYQVAMEEGLITSADLDEDFDKDFDADVSRDEVYDGMIWRFLCDETKPLPGFPSPRQLHIAPDPWFRDAMAMEAIREMCYDWHMRNNGSQTM